MVLILITFSIQGVVSTASIFGKEYLLKKNNDRLTAKQAQKMTLIKALEKKQNSRKPYRGC
jgi:hypothetical protein